MRKRQKTVSGGHVSFEGKGAFGGENKYDLFYGKWGLEYFFISHIFEKVTFLEKMEEILGEHNHF